MDANVERLIRPAGAAHKSLRIATKSLRSPALAGYVAARAGAIIHGLMTYTAAETHYYATDGAALVGPPARNLLLAYSLRPSRRRS